jgi:hypothetical protein
MLRIIGCETQPLGCCQAQAATPRGRRRIRKLDYMYAHNLLPPRACHCCAFRQRQSQYSFNTARPEPLVHCELRSQKCRAVQVLRRPGGGTLWRNRVRGTWRTAFSTKGMKGRKRGRERKLVGTQGMGTTIILIKS